MSMIRVHNLTKTFKRPIRPKGLRGAINDLFNRQYETKVAVKDLSFEVNKGEIVGYLGPNGAGKSTSIKMLVGILVPTEGSVQVNGIVPYNDRTLNAKQIGVVFGQRSQLWWDIPVSETLYMMKYMYRIPDDIFKHNMDIFTDILDIGSFQHVAVRQLSLGQRMRADLCAALLHNPQVVFLDEPTIGLDIVAKKKIREFLLEINQVYKTTIMLTTHDMSDIEKLCSRVIVINDGQKVYDGLLDGLKRNYGSGELMKVQTEVPWERDYQDLYAIGVNKVEYVDETKFNIQYNKETISSTNLLTYIMNKARIIDFEVRPSEIEEVIREIYDRAAKHEHA